MSSVEFTGHTAAALLERSISYALGRVGEVRPEQLADPTPCAHWDLRALLWHAADSLSMLIEGGAHGRIGLRPPADGADPLLAFRDRAAAVVGAWSRPASRRTVRIGDAVLPSAVVASAGALEIAVHGWDIAQTCRGTPAIPESLASELLALCPWLIATAGRTPMFAPAVPVPDKARAGDRLVALLGRDPFRRRRAAAAPASDV